jgi:hypothetical protein
VSKNAAPSPRAEGITMKVSMDRQREKKRSTDDSVQLQMFDKHGKATRPEQVTTVDELPARWFRVWEAEYLARLSTKVPADETKAYALSLVLGQWGRERARRELKKNHPQLW